MRIEGLLIFTGGGFTREFRAACGQKIGQHRMPHPRLRILLVMPQAGAGPCLSGDTDWRPFAETEFGGGDAGFDIFLELI